MTTRQLEFCTTRLEGRVLTVTINRPEVMNSLHPAANFELEQVFDDFAADSEQWVAILTGSKNALKGAGFFLGGVLLDLCGVGALVAMLAGGELIAALAVGYAATALGGLWLIGLAIYNECCE